MCVYQGTGWHRVIWTPTLTNSISWLRYGFNLWSNYLKELCSTVVDFSVVCFWHEVFTLKLQTYTDLKLICKLPIRRWRRTWRTWHEQWAQDSTLYCSRVPPVQVYISQILFHGPNPILSTFSKSNNTQSRDSQLQAINCFTKSSKYHFYRIINFHRKFNKLNLLT